MIPSGRAKLNTLITRWDELMSGNNSGAELLEQQRSIANEAVEKLGPSRELEIFLEYLRERGAGNLRHELITGGLRTLFAGDDATDAREWALEYANDRPTREALMRLAGEEFRGPGFAAFFERVGEAGCHHSQAALLSGYCTMMARTNPMAVSRMYRDMVRPKRIDITGMRHLMEVFPENTDFIAIAGDEIRGLPN